MEAYSKDQLRAVQYPALHSSQSDLDLVDHRNVVVLPVLPVDWPVLVAVSMIAMVLPDVMVSVAEAVHTILMLVL